MVFESVLTQVLNRFIGDYVENLDRDQLNVGIWGGDVKLTNLILKQTALDELDLPIQTVYGRIGKLVLKIPWKNLYGSAVVINVEDVYLLAKPNQQVIYNAEKEDQKAFEAKKKEIEKVEAAKKIEEDRDKPQADSSFVEKIIAQIIKNVQLNIKNIHIRYEDKVTNPGYPFAVGITLSELNVVSTNSKWEPHISSEVSSKIYKIVNLEGLAVYWNCNTTTYDEVPKVDLLNKMVSEIATKSYIPADYRYVLGPINASARLRLNQKPEYDSPAFSVPKVHLNLDMEKLAVGISKKQYRDIIALANSMDLMSKGVPYRKYRPKVPSYKGHYKEWWKFAYTCIVEEQIKRRKRNWDWNHISQHRDLCRQYGELYQNNLLNQGKVKGSEIEEVEKKLDIFNIIIIRQRIQLETERLVKLQNKSEKKSWFGWMWGSGSANDENASMKSGTDILKQFENAMTSDEKSRLYKAIDYQENAAPAQYPEGFVDNSCTFVLRSLEVELRDEVTVLVSKLKGVKVRLDTRAAASALKVHVKIDELETLGTEQEDFIPKMITSEIVEGGSGLLEVTFETNPIDKKCGQRVHVLAQPLKIVYDAMTINKIIDVFKVPESSALDQLSVVAGQKASEYKAMTAIGLQHAIDKHIVLDLDILIHAPLIIVPHGGKYTESENVLVVNLGNVRIYSIAKEEHSVKQLHTKGANEQEIMDAMMKNSYDEIKLELKSIQILVAQSDENWKTTIQSGKTTNMHVLTPMNLNMTLYKCLFSDDPRLPLNKIRGSLESIHVNLSDARLILLLSLGTSIPLPTEKEEVVVSNLASMHSFSSNVNLKNIDIAKPKSKIGGKGNKELESDEDFELTSVDFQFVFKELAVNLYHQDEIASKAKKLVTFAVENLETAFIQKTFITQVDLRLSKIGLIQYREHGNINIISTPLTDSKEKYLFKVSYLQVNRNSPKFYTIYKCCESGVILEFSKLAVDLHQEGLLWLMRFANDIQQQVNEIVGNNKDKTLLSTSSSNLRRSMSQLSESIPAASKIRKGKSKKIVDAIKFKLNACVEEVTIKLTSDAAEISSFTIKGIQSEVIVKHTYTQINAILEDLMVIDLNPETLHKKILVVIGDEALNVQLVLYNLTAEDYDKPDISLQATMGGLRIIFLNWFVTNMLKFLNNFQAAQEKIIEASHQAAETAKSNVQEAYEKATKISLNVNIKAPDIIVPVSSKSMDCFLLDLGHLTLINSFNFLEVYNENKQSAIIDELRINLSSLKLARIQLSSSREIINDCPLLKPFNLKFMVKRNLSSWHKNVPGIDISGSIDSIELLLSQADYSTLMQTLNENLSEGKESEETVQHVAISAQPSKLTTATYPKTTVASIEQFGESKNINTFLRFSFSMDKFVITLYTKGPNSKSLSSTSPTYDKTYSLGQFSMEGLSIKGRMMSDDSLVTSILLVNCILEDTRVGREDKLTRMIESNCSNTESTGLKSMIDVTYKQTPTDKFADIRVCSVKVILSVEYLKKIGEFFAPPETVTTPKYITEKKSNKSVAKPKKLNEDGVRMTVNLKLEKPDIILVEKMDDFDTNALFLNCLILLKYRTTPGSHQVISGSINDLQLYTASYNIQKRNETRSDLLHPITISVAGSTPEDKGLHVEVIFTDVIISVSPVTIGLLNRIMATFSSQPDTTDEESISSINFANLWVDEVYQETDFWFFKTDVACEANEELGKLDIPEDIKILSLEIMQELCIVAIPRVILTLETGLGNKTLPLLMLESSFKGNVRNWSTQLSVDASLNLEMGYFNSSLALWEPIIEPVEVMKDDKPIFVPWELKLEVSMNEPEEPTLISPGGEEELQLLPPVMSIDVTSESNLELSVTKTCLEVLNTLGKAFASAIEEEEQGQLEVSLTRYKLFNDTGTSITLLLDKGSFDLHENESTEVVLENKADVHLQLKQAFDKDDKKLLKCLRNDSLIGKNYNVFVKINDKNCELELPVIRADKRFFTLNYRGDGNDNWGIISEVVISGGVTIVTLRSILQVFNHLHVAVDVYYMTKKGNELECIATIQPGTKENIPLSAVYTNTNEIFFSIDKYTVTTSPYVWKDLQTNLSITKLMQCLSKDTEQGNEPFLMKAIGEMEQVYFENTCRHTMASTCYNIHLRPAVTLKNLLPIKLICVAENVIDERIVEPGETLQLPNVDPEQSCLIFRLPEYLEKEWSCRHQLNTTQEFSVLSFASYDSARKVVLDLGLHLLNDNGSLILSIYCPFWMLNKTGKMITYRKSKKTERNDASGSPSKNNDENMNVIHHPPNFKGPILFSFNAKNFFGKKKASIRVEDGDWSDKFSLDVAGSAGVVTCRGENMIYQIGVHNQLTYNSFTKQVTFMPYYVIINTAPYAIQCQEQDRPGDPWVVVEPNSSSALWPFSDSDDKLLKLRVVGTDEISAPFLYTESHTTLLKLNNKYGGVNVDIQITEGAFYINLAPYSDGIAPALIINHTRDAIQYWEKESVQLRTLKPKHKIFYTWQNPSGPRVLLWETSNKKECEDDLRKDGIGEYILGEDYHVYWVSFLFGMQRVLLFTENKSVAEDAQSATQFEIIQQEIVVSLHGLGLSLVNNETRQEVVYIGIASTGIIWETCKINGRRFKQLPLKDSALMEAAYQRYLLKKEQNVDDSGKELVDQKTAVDFEAGQMLKPHKRIIRRTFQTGLWFNMKTSPTQLQLHAKINKLQIDNQTYDCTFPIALAPVPPPKSVAADTGIKPFAEVSIVQLLIKNSQIKQFKYFKVLIQEFHIKLDMGLINSIFEILQTAKQTEEEEKELFLNDMQLVEQPLDLIASTHSIKEQKSFYDLLHFSPLKVHISFSITAGASSSAANTPNFVNVLLQGLGVTLTDMQDVIFKLAYFEREYTFLTQKQLVGEASSHYVGQAVKQLYVLVLGLDVLGNPYGLVLGITKGVEDLFYEPFQGAIQGPGEFAEGLVLGVRSLFGHTVGGAAGAVSRMTGALGKGIAALTFDKDYQRKRRDQLTKKPATVQEGLARSGKGLVMGVYDGVTGVFTKPFSGAKEQGVEGFFKGLGKGAVGLVARPTAGVIDFASGSLDAVKRCAELNQETLKLRPPRFLRSDGLVRPYVHHEAEGNKFLMDLEKGKYATTDIYFNHYIVVARKEVLLITDKRLAYITHNDIFGGWQVDWAYTWQDLQHPVKVVPKGISIPTSETKKKKLGLFGSNESAKIVLINDPVKKEELCLQIESLRGSA